MALCINQSGTWRNITTQCVNQSGTWRKVATGCINQSGTWRMFITPFWPGGPGLGSFACGGYVICAAANVGWIVAPASSQVSRTWYLRNDAVTTAQSVSGCTGWFVPTCGQLQNPGYTCKTYWDSFSGSYWSSTERTSTSAWRVFFNYGGAYSYYKSNTLSVRAFRCVTY